MMCWFVMFFYQNADHENTIYHLTEAVTQSDKVMRTKNITPADHYRLYM